MKKRVKIDSAILSFIIIMTGFLFIFRDIYPRNPFLDDALDCAADCWSEDASGLMRNAVQDYISDGFNDECASLEESTQLRSLGDNLAALGEKYDVDVSASVLSAEKKADEVTEYEEQAADHQYEMWREDRHFEREESSRIESMFDTLRRG